MIPKCPVCHEEMELRMRGEVMPTDMFDDASVLLYRCPMLTHAAMLTLVQSERRGSMDDETIDIMTIPLAEHTLHRLYELGDQCPDRNHWKCDCAWHKECAADALIKRQTSLALQPNEPYSDEDDREKNAYHYGVST